MIREVCAPREPFAHVVCDDCGAEARAMSRSPAAAERHAAGEGFVPVLRAGQREHVCADCAALSPVAPASLLEAARA